MTLNPLPEAIALLLLNSGVNDPADDDRYYCGKIAESIVALLKARGFEGVLVEPESGDWWVETDVPVEDAGEAASACLVVRL